MYLGMYDRNTGRITSSHYVSLRSAACHFPNDRLLRGNRSRGFQLCRRPRLLLQRPHRPTPPFPGLLTALVWCTYRCSYCADIRNAYGVAGLEATRRSRHEEGTPGAAENDQLVAATVPAGGGQGQNRAGQSIRPAHRIGFVVDLRRGSDRSWLVRVVDQVGDSPGLSRGPDRLFSTVGLSLGLDRPFAWFKAWVGSAIR